MAGDAPKLSGEGEGEGKGKWGRGNTTYGR